MKIAFIGHSFHLKTRSDAFFVELLRKCGEVDVLMDSSWRRDSTLEWASGFRQDDYDCVVAYQSPAVFSLLKPGHPNLVFVPMYDAMVSEGSVWWREEFNSAKALCFSSALYREIAAYSPISHYAQFYPDPAQLPKPAHAARLDAFFWYRQAPITSELLSRLTAGTRFDRLTLHDAPDPVGASPQPGSPEPRAGERVVTSWFPDRESYLSMLAERTVFFASRLHEGIGVSFLEAMAMGLCVVAPATATHTEYISHGTNGLLYSPAAPAPISLADHATLGARAREQVSRGRVLWERAEPALLEFISTPRERLEKRPAVIDFWRRAQTAPEPPAREGLPKVTVVTVCLNAAHEIEATLDSVAEQDYPTLQYLVWDGGSSDGTLAILERRARELDHWEVRPRMRIFTAMADALSHVNGEYVLYLNAGDRFTSRSAVSALFTGTPARADVIYGHHIYVREDGVDEPRSVTDFEQTWSDLRLGRLSQRWLQGIPCHQATAVRASLLREFGFDPALRIAADHDLLFRLRRAGARFHNRAEPVAIYSSGGLSSRFAELCVGEWTRIASRYGSALAARRFYAGLSPDSANLWAAAVRGALDRIGGASRRRFGRVRQATESTASSDRYLPPRGPVDRLALWFGRALAPIAARFGRPAGEARRAPRGASRREGPDLEGGIGIDFRKAERPRAVIAWSGLSHREEWGRWTDGARAEVFFERPLPARLRLVVEAHAFGPNSRLPIRWSVGKSVVEMRIEELPIRSYVVDLDTSGRDHGVVIDIPSPLAPAQLQPGPDADQRRLGIGLQSLRILER